VEGGHRKLVGILRSFHKRIRVTVLVLQYQSCTQIGHKEIRKEEIYRDDVCYYCTHTKLLA